jgi:hypothetical protein
MKIIFTLSMLLLFFQIHSQTLPASRSINWAADAGVDGGIPCITSVYDVTTLSITTDRILTANSGAVNSTNLNKIVNDLVNYPAPCVFYFPAGTYSLANEVAIRYSGRVIRGESAAATKFLSASTANCFRAEPQSSPTSAANDNPNGGSPLASAVAVTAGFTQGSMLMTVADASSFVTGQYFEIYQADNATQVTQPQTWARNAVGMIAKIVSVNTGANQVTIDRPLRIDFNSSGGYIRARNINLITQVGFENFYVTRTNSIDNSSANTIFFRNAANGWVCGLESEKTQMHHVRTETATDITIKNNYFHHSYLYTADHGYGARCGYHCGSCYIENNIFFTLRHAMLVEQGASGNVYVYNYANNMDDPAYTRANSPGQLDQATISIHGHYCNMNLFEGNIVEEIECTDAFGSAGPGNTFLRNRIVAQGVSITNTSNDENIIGNELPSGGSNVIYYSGTSSTGTLIHGNNQHGSIAYDSTYSTSVNNSYFFTSSPSFFASSSWPSIGPEFTLGSGAIPAEARYKAGSSIPAVFSCSVVTAVKSGSTSQEISVYPNPFSGKVSIKGNGLSRAELIDAFGKLVMIIEGNMNDIDLSNFHKGIYILRVFSKSGEAGVIKVMKE